MTEEPTYAEGEKLDHQPLSESTLYHNTIVDSVQVGILIINSDNHIIKEVNRMGEELIGLPKDQIIGKKCHCFVCPAEEGRCPVTDLGQKVERSERILLTAESKQRPILKTAVPHTIDGQHFILESFVDLSEQKAAKEKAQQEAAKLAAMISGMEEGVVFADAKGVVVEVNDFFCRFIGQPRETILGQSMQAFHPEAVWLKLDHILDGFHSGLDRGAHVIQRRLGENEVVLRMQPIYRDTRYEGVLLNVIDVTELVKARKAAEKAIRTKSEFLATMNNEMRNPLNNIIGMVKLLLNSDLNSNQYRYLEAIANSSNYLLKLVNEILTLSSITAGQVKLNNFDFRLQSVVEDAVGSQLHEAEKKGLEIICQIKSDVPQYLSGDPQRLQQIIVSLVMNAIKFTNSGEIRVQCEIMALEANRLILKFTVADTGIGIPCDKQALVFDSFQQADSGTSRKYYGAGLGLSITRQIVYLMGGQIWVESTPGSGSTFYFTARFSLPENPQEGRGAGHAKRY